MIFLLKISDFFVFSVSTLDFHIGFSMAKAYPKSSGFFSPTCFDQDTSQICKLVYFLNAFTFKRYCSIFNDTTFVNLVFYVSSFSPFSPFFLKCFLFGLLCLLCGVIAMLDRQQSLGPQGCSSVSSI